VFLIFSFDANAESPNMTLCRIVLYIHSIGGPMITVIIIGAALLAIFGKMPWPALFALGVFTAVFFGAPKIVSVVAPSIEGQCCATVGQIWGESLNKCVVSQV